MFIVSYSCRSIDLTSLYVLFSQYKSRDNTLRNSFFQISSYLREHLRIHCEKTAGQVPLGPLLGKQNIQAKEVYCAMLQTYNEIDVTRLSYIRWAAKLCIYCQLQGGDGGGGWQRPLILPLFGFSPQLRNLSTKFENCSEHAWNGLRTTTTSSFSQRFDSEKWIPNHDKWSPLWTVHTSRLLMSKRSIKKVHRNLFLMFRRRKT